MVKRISNVPVSYSESYNFGLILSFLIVIHILRENANISLSFQSSTNQ